MASNWRTNVNELGFAGFRYTLIARYLPNFIGTEWYLAQQTPTWPSYTILVRPVGSNEIPVNIGAAPRIGPSFEGYEVEPD